jgi:hypothetical protein
VVATPLSSLDSAAAAVAPVDFLSASALNAALLFHVYILINK